MKPLTIAYFAVLHALALAAFVLPWRWELWPVMLGVYGVAGLGTTVGYHRLLAHRSFRCPRWLEHVLITGGMINTPGSPLLWVANHRCHHAHADQPGDPHSPTQGLFYSHIGWICVEDSTPAEGWRTWAKDLGEDRYYQWLLRYRMVPQLAAIALVGALWGPAQLPQLFFLPTVAWMHATFSVNSICHAFGARPVDMQERAGNVAALGVLALGEGWHNNHHAKPWSARIGLRWWQLDLGWWFVWALERVGLAWDVKVPRGG